MAETLPITDNTRFSRLRKCASYDKAVINQILDAGILCFFRRGILDVYS
ncbi:hypothetical protein [Spartinivicinus poritis]|uniref:Ribosomal protein S14 n=1 Tax=Spartinivicinus poritis TaxID=2994640 RepID=A0ABT5UBT6_9GAMM|nr:hypothetical protein [Spartinivicinus sp. A2-2]MDE1463840.1 hypothetical protein [Spartinivicinus sp. A2-2]